MKNQIQWDALEFVLDKMHYAAMGQDRFSVLASYSESRERSEAIAVLRKLCDAGTKVELVRLKYRSQNGFGQQMIAETMFMVIDGEASAIDSRLEVLFSRAWNALVAGENGKAINVPLTAEESTMIEGQRAMLDTMLNFGK